MKKVLVIVLLLVLGIVSFHYYYSSDNRKRIVPGDGDIRQIACPPGYMKKTGEDGICIKEEKVITKESVSTKTDTCTDIVGSTFLSVKEFPVGLPVYGGPNNTEKIPLRFKTNMTFERLYSDYIEHGTYICTNNTIKLSFSDSQTRTATIQYDPKNKTVVLFDIEYKKQ